MRWRSLLIRSAELCSALIRRLGGYQTAPYALMPWVRLLHFQGKQGRQARKIFHFWILPWYYHGLDMAKVWEKATEKFPQTQQYRLCWVACEKDGDIKEFLTERVYRRESKEEYSSKRPQVWHYFSWCREREKLLYRYVLQHLPLPLCSSCRVGGRLTFYNHRARCHPQMGLYRSHFPHCIIAS